MKIDGRQIDDEMLINLIQKRLQFKDCQTNGWVLEDFPKTKAQAIIMSKKGLVPSNVFFMKGDLQKAFERTREKLQSRFGADRRVLT